MLLGLPVPFILPITSFMLCDDLDPGTRRGPFELLVIPGVLLDVDGGCVVGVPMVDDEGEVGVVCGALVGLFWPACDVTVVWGCTLAKPIEILGRKLHVLRAEPAGCPAGYPR